jgi:gliding motility-associated-like protein
MYDLFNSNGTLINSNQGFTNYSFNNLVPGNYYLNIKNNSEGCKTSVGFKVEGPIKYYLSQTAFGCGGGCTNQAKFNLTGGAPPQSILWGNGNTGPTASGLCGGGWTKVTLVDNSGNCTMTDSIFITSLPGPQVAFQFNKTYYCSSDSVAILSDFPGTGGGNFSLAFTTGGVNFSDVNSFNGEVNLLNVTSSGFAVIKYEVNTPCNAIFLDTIYYSPSMGPVTLTTYHDRSLCYGDPDPLFYNSQTSNKIIWYDEFGNFLGNQFPGNSFDPFLGSSPFPGTYYFHVTQSDTNSTTCESYPKQVRVDVFDKPVVFAGEDISVCPGFGVQLHASGADNYNWQPAIFLDDQNSQTPIASIDNTTLFYLKGTSNLTGCSSFDSVMVYIDSLSGCGLVIYNGFTPNADGHNDFWFIDGISDDSKNRVTIFNRWGERVWEVFNYDNHNNKWDGQNYKGEYLPDGTYYYLINYKGDQLKGWVELTR